MKLRADYHSHTKYSDGKGSMEDNVRAAVEQGLKTFAITDHGFGHGFFGMKRRNLKKMQEEIYSLREKYPQIRIFFGIEANIRGSSGTLDIKKDEFEEFDIILAGYHFGSLPGSWEDLTTHLLNFVYKFTGLFKRTATRKNTLGILKALESYPISILTHPGDKGPVDLQAIARTAARHGVAMEINERHGHLTTEELIELAPYKLNYIASSDAHSPEKIAQIPGVLARIREAKVPLSQVANLEE